MTVPRLHVTERLEAGQSLRIVGDRAHYLRNVLRLRAGASLQLFSAVDGEWRATVASVGRHALEIAVEERLRPPAAEPGPTLVFAPIRRNRLDWLIEKAVELGVARLVPVLTAADRRAARGLGAAGGDRRRGCRAVRAAERADHRPAAPAGGMAGRTRVPTPLLFADERGEGAPLGRGPAGHRRRRTCWWVPRAACARGARGAAGGTRCSAGQPRGQDPPRRNGCGLHAGGLAAGAAERPVSGPALSRDGDVNWQGGKVSVASPILRGRRRCWG